MCLQSSVFYGIISPEAYIIPRPFDPSGQRGNLHFKWCASPGGDVAKLWYDDRKLMQKTGFLQSSDIKMQKHRKSAGAAAFGRNICGK